MLASQLLFSGAMASLTRSLLVALAALIALAGSPAGEADAAASGSRGVARKASSKRADKRNRRKPSRDKASSASRSKGPKSSAGLTLPERMKFRRVARFESKPLAGVRKFVDKQLENPSADLPTAKAAIIRLMDTGYLRVGSARYAQGEKPSFGASSLRKEHVRVRGSKVSLRFRGKSGVSWKRTLDDPELAAAVRVFMKLPGDRLFQYPTKTGRLIPVTEATIGAALKSFSPDALPKDFRTLHANRIFVQALKEFPKPKTEAEAEKQIKKAIEVAAKALNHEPDTSRDNYLNPAHAEAHRARAPKSARGPPKK